MSDRCQTNVLQTVSVCACVSPLAPDMAGCSGTRCWFPTGFQVSTAVLSGAHLLLLVLWSVVWWRVGALVWAGLDVTSYIGTRGRGSGLVQAYIYIYTYNYTRMEMLQTATDRKTHTFSYGVSVVVAEKALALRSW